MRASRLAFALPFALAAAYALAACSGRDAAEALASGDDWTYVGDEACASCHADVYTDYHRTGMGRSVSLFEPQEAPEQFDARGESPQICGGDGYCYVAFVRGDSLFQRETRPDTPDWNRTYAVSHVVGSGNATRSYFMTVGEADSTAAYVTEMPLTWYVEREIWDLSPGYDQNNERFERPINPECMACHNTAPPHATSQNAFGEIPLGISCERCHGPGSAHVETFDAGGASDDTRIVNPSTLSADLELDVCQQCHLTGISVFAPGEDAATYRPGRPLAAHRAVFARQEELDDPEAFGIASHAERMRRSACFQETEGLENAMTCTTCHDPHKPAEEGSYNVACQSCHGGAAHETVCARPDTSGLEEAMTGNCVSCHMRSAGTSDIPHVSFTDHWIQREPAPSDTGTRLAPEAFKRQTPFTLVDLAGSHASGAEADVQAGIAYLALYDTEHRLPHYLTEATTRIRRGMGAGADRVDGRIALGRALLAQRDMQGAETELAAAVQLAPENGIAAYWLGVARTSRGDARGAIAPLRDAVRLAPRFTEARTELAEALAASGDTAGAVRALEEAVRLDPIRHAGAWNDLGLYRLQLGRVAPARQALRRAVHLDPMLAPAWVTLGAAALQAGDAPEAERAFLRALRADPASTGALGNLAVLRAQQGRTGDARTLLQQLLAADPSDTRARSLLAELGS